MLHKGDKVEVATNGAVPAYKILGHVESVQQCGDVAGIHIRGLYVAGADRGAGAEITVEGVKTSRRTAAVPVFQRHTPTSTLSIPITVTKVSV